MLQGSPVIIQRRLPLLAAFVILIAVILFIRLWFLQAVKGEYYYDLSENNQIRPIRIKPPRGIIYDRNGRLLVENVLTFDISIVPENTPDLGKTIDALASLIQITPEEIHRALDSAASVRAKYEPAKVKEEVSWREVAVTEARHEDLPGVIVDPEHRRYYPHGGIASHQLGYIGRITRKQLKREKTDRGRLTGQAGLERTYDTLLRGVSGRRMIQVNAAGMKVKDLGVEYPRPGKDLYLTIDIDVQIAAEEALGKRLGGVVAMDPTNGEVLALVSHPNYDPNLFPRGISPKDWEKLSTDPSFPLYNRAVQSVYPPGSIFKIIVALAGLDSGAITPDDEVTCKGVITYGRHSYRCWRRKGHGTLSLHRAIVESCDVYFYTMGERIGFDQIAKYARSFGLGSVTGIRLPDEKPGLIPTQAWKEKTLNAPWYPGDTYINSIGQGFDLLSPIQACQMISAIANGGFLYRPKLLKRIRNRENGKVTTFSPEHKGTIILNQKALEGVRKGLIGVVSERGGTGWAARSRLTTVAGKTGTAQVVAQKDPRKKLTGKIADHAWFVAYAPVENPTIAVAVLVENGGHGGATAAPIARKVIEEFMKSDGTKMAH